ncbi:MAG: preprotein translocase subunit SecG [Eubacteriaceae bacterium]|nr:preprotein translocase subunit SecG [Eubacteriaceae bacterium]
MKTLLAVIIFISSVAVIVSVVLQEAKDSGMSSAITGNSNSLFGKGRVKTLDATLQRITVIAGGVLAVAVFAMGVFFS